MWSECGMFYDESSNWKPVSPGQAGNDGGYSESGRAGEFKVWFFYSNPSGLKHRESDIVI
jgi:hypothetical protein